MDLQIRTVSNGYILSYNEECMDEEYGIKHKEVIFEVKSDEEKERVECLAEVLQFISNIVGPSTSRYSEKRINVVTRPGDKREDFEWCERCNGEGIIKTESILNKKSKIKKVKRVK